MKYRPNSLVPLTLLLAFTLSSLPAPIQAEESQKPSSLAHQTRAGFSLPHSHNDYEHGRPLLDALEQGIFSIEADIWLEGGQILVAHDRGNYKGTLRELYLDPLERFVKALYVSERPIHLWLDIKDSNVAIVEVLHRLLRRYPMLTRFTDSEIDHRDVTVILTGDAENKQRYVDQYETRYACRDSNDYSPSDLPADRRWLWYALNWDDYIDWDGEGTIPDKKYEKLVSILDDIHAKSRKVRFYSTPDIPDYWNLALETGIDLINTDRLNELRIYLDNPTSETASLLKPFIDGSAVTAKPVQITNGMFTGAKTRIQVRNDGNIPIRWMARLVPHDAIYSPSRYLYVSVPPNSVQSVDVTLNSSNQVPLAQLNPLVYEWSAAYDVPCPGAIEFEGETRVVFDGIGDCYHRPTPVLVDGNLEDWGMLDWVCTEPASISSIDGKWTGAGDCMFRFDTAYDERHVYLAVEVFDDQWFPGVEAKPSAKDHIEIWFDAKPGESDPEDAKNGDRLYFQLSPGVSLEGIALEGTEKSIEKAIAVCKKTETGYAAEVAIPSEFLNVQQGRSWEEFCLNIAINDHDPNEGGGAKLFWRPEWGKGSESVPGVFRRR